MDCYGLISRGDVMLIKNSERYDGIPKDKISGPNLLPYLFNGLAHCNTLTEKVKGSRRVYLGHSKFSERPRYKAESWVRGL